MKKVMCLALIICLAFSQAALAEGLLPPLEETIGRAMPSLGEALQRYPDSETQNEDGSETDLYQKVSEEEFGRISLFLEKTGATLADYQVSGNVMTARIQVNNGYFLLKYDSGECSIEVTYPAGTYDERLKSARTHLAVAQKYYSEGEEGKAREQLGLIPQREAYRPAADPFKGISKPAPTADPETADQKAQAGGPDDAASTPPDAENAEPVPADEKEGANPTETAPALPTPSPEPTDEPYPLPEDADRSVEILKGQRTVSVGKLLKLQAEVTKLKDDAPEKTDVEWSSEDPAVAAVSDKGEVTGLKPGSVRITVNLKDRPEIRTFARIHVVNPVRTIKTDKSVTLLYGASEDRGKGKLPVTIEPEDATIRTCIYTSSNEEVVKVDGEGNLQAVGPGKARITIISAEEGSKAKADCAVTVAQAVQSISLPRSITIDKRKNASLKAEIQPKDATSKALEFTSSNERIATVSKNGTVTAVACGKATITAAAADGSGVTAACEVTVIQPVTRVSSMSNKIVLFEGQEQSWSTSVEPYDATNRKLSFSSDSSYVAAVDSNGRITAKSAGKARITATAVDGSNKSCTCSVIVEPSEAITLESIGYGVYMGNLFAMTVTNQCSTMTIVDFDFDLSFYDYSDRLVNGGSFSLGKEERIGPGREKTIKRNVYGTSQAYKTVITITGVKFADGTTWSIPYSQQKTWTFTR